MKKAYIFGWILAAAMLLPGCTGEEKPVPEEKGGVQVRIALDGLMTKTTTPGEGAENTVSCLDVIVFSADGTQQLYSWLHGSYSTEGGYYVYSTTVDGITAISGTPAEKAEVLQNARVLAIANYPGAVGDFSGKTLEQVQALALEASSASAAAGKFICLATADRYSVLDTPSFVMTGLTAAGNGFAKTGEGLVAGITLKRLAAKVSLTLTYPTDHITTDGHDAGLNVDTKTVWEPMLGGNTRIYLENGALDALLGGAKAKGTQTSFAYTDTYPSGDPLVSGTFYTYPLTWDEGSSLAPFIKIIQPWRYRTVIADEGASQGTVIDENVVELYYKVMLPGLTALESNTWYKPTVQLSVLGGEASRPTVLNATGLDILAWGSVVSGTDVSEIEIQPVKYLVVEQENTTVTNGNKVQVRYFASGPATLTVNRIYKEVFTNTSKEDREFYPTKHANVNDLYDKEYNASTGSFYDSPWFSNTYDDSKHEGIITLNHELSTNFNYPNFAARPYNYSLTLSLDGVPDQSFTITQIPSILVGGQHSYGCVYVNNHIQNGENNNNTSGTAIIAYTAPSKRAFDGTATLYNVDNNIHIYGFTAADGGNHGDYSLVFTKSGSSTAYSSGNNTAVKRRQAMRCFLGTVASYIDLGEGPNNISQYRIIVQSAPLAGKYIISPLINTTEDSATPAFQNLDNIINNSYSTSNSTRDVSPFATSTSESDATHTAVKAYQPGIRVEKGRDYIAPEFMAASSWGKTWGVYFEQAVLRCASYQEDGYPAGRWRLPTEAELHYLMDLNSKHAIPDLVSNRSFASSGRMWNGSAFVEPDDASVSSFSGLGFARCVYDTWYWGRGEDKTLHDSRGAAQTINGVSGRYLYPWSGFVTAKRETLPPSDEDF